MRIGIISEVQGNVVALKAVLDKVKNVDLWLHAGNLVGINAFPNETIEICRELAKKKKFVSVLGNFDRAVLGYEMDGFEEEEKKAIEWTREKISEENSDFLSALPTSVEEAYEGKKLFMVNGSPRDPFGEGINNETNEKYLDLIVNDYDVLVTGRWLAPLVKKVGKKKKQVVINPGSLGNPTSDKPRAACMYFDFVKGKELDGDFEGVEYKFEDVKKENRKNGLAWFI
ncbi:Calcineurin-like phosphoesterase superfamily domain protein [Candidatus Gugararchaeum adminiculabundum]|nr:Calcineurin-like phosphoesterase superfamily domain protein [Candidatus Gugararchaeum adminiculabundum]